MSHQAARYRPPPRGVCDVEEQVIELAHDLAKDEIHALRRQLWWYRSQLAYFCLEQRVEGADGISHIVCRIDVSDGAVRRHSFNRSGDAAESPAVLVTVPPRDRTVLGAEYERISACIIDDWEVRSQSPIVTGERLMGARELIRKLREITAGQDRSVPRAALQYRTILALENERAIDVTNRLNKHPQPYLLAVYFPDRDRIVLAELTSLPTTPGTVGARTDISIGMIIDSAGHVTE